MLSIHGHEVVRDGLGAQLASEEQNCNIITIIIKEEENMKQRVLILVNLGTLN